MTAGVQMVEAFDRLPKNKEKNNIVVKPKFMCPTHSEAKQTEMAEFGAEKLVLVKEAPTRKMGDLDSSQIHLAGWPGAQGF